MQVSEKSEKDVFFLILLSIFEVWQTLICIGRRWFSGVRLTWGDRKEKTNDHRGNDCYSEEAKELYQVF